MPGIGKMSRHLVPGSDMPALLAYPDASRGKPKGANRLPLSLDRERGPTKSAIYMLLNDASPPSRAHAT